MRSLVAISLTLALVLTGCEAGSTGDGSPSLEELHALCEDTAQCAKKSCSAEREAVSAHYQVEPEPDDPGWDDWEAQLIALDDERRACEADACLVDVTYDDASRAFQSFCDELHVLDEACAYGLGLADANSSESSPSWCDLLSDSD